MAAVKERVAVKTRARFDELYRQLNKEQRRAVDEIEGVVMVLAGPGTGKTQVLAARVANILRQTQMDPGNILCLTFTESAAAAMRRRLIDIISEAAYYVRISTFHAFCNDVIREWPEKFALGGGRGQALSDMERVELFRSLLDKLPGASQLKPFGNPYLYLRDVIENVKRLKQEGLSSDEFRAVLERVGRFTGEGEEVLAGFFAMKASERDDETCDKAYRQLEGTARSLNAEALWLPMKKKYEKYLGLRGTAETKKDEGKLRTILKNDWRRVFNGMKNQLPKHKDLWKVYEAYQRELAKRGRYDYEDMVMMVVDRLQDDGDLLAHYQERWQYILVDEYQDTNGAQNEVVRLLSSFYPNPNVFVVGDDKQSVFRFQGASMENLLSMYEQYRGYVKVITLKNNYRSQQTVLDAADRVIANNKGLLTEYIPEATVELVGKSGEKSTLLERREFDTEDDELYGVARKIKELIEAGVEPDEIAVLYRFNRDGEDLLGLMSRLEVPARLEAGEDVLRDGKIKQFLGLLTYLADKQKDETLAEILQYDFWGLDSLEVLKILYYVNGKNRLWRVLTDRRLLEEAGVSDPGPFLQLMKRLAQWRAVEKNFTLQHFFDVVLSESGFLDYVLRDSNRLPLLNKVSTVFNEIKRMSRDGESLGIKDFAARVCLLRDNGVALTAEPWRTKKKAARLMTVHKAKGLEFEQVFLIKLTDHHWGNVRNRNRVPLPAGIVKFDPIREQENNEDERRLFYVALTRARRQVYLSSARYGSRGQELVPAIFVREIGSRHMNEVDTAEREEEAVERLKMGLAPARLPADGGTRDWLRERLEGYVMSVTHLNNYLECPRLFYYRNLLRVPAAKTKHMAFGTAVHGALRDLFVRLNEKGRWPGEKYLIDRFGYYLSGEDLTDSEREDSAQFGKTVLGNYYRFYKGSLPAKVLVEYDFRSHNARLGDLTVTGKLDKVELLDGKRVNVVDYKTGNPDSAARHLREGGNYRRQLVFYKLLGDLSPRFPYEVVSGEIDFVQPSKRTGRLTRKKFVIADEEVEQLKEVVERAGREIRELKFLDSEGCGECEYCKK